MTETNETGPSHARHRRDFLRSGLPLAVGAVGAVLTEKGAACQASSATVPDSVPNLSALRQVPAPQKSLARHVMGYRTPGDGGGGVFVWDPKYSPDPLAPPDDGGTYILPQGAAPASVGRWRRQFTGALNAKWFGAMGDNSGSTPADTGVDIAMEAWNSDWPGWIAAQRAPQITRFTNNDSWDAIGIQMAMLSVGANHDQMVGGNSGEVYIPGGHYLLSRPLIYSGGMHTTLTGAGMYQTMLSKTPGRFKNSYIFTMTDTGGQPTTIRNLGLTGPPLQSFDELNDLNFMLAYLSHTNGVHIENCWLTSCNLGMLLAGTTDCFISGCTSEYCGITFDVGPGSDVHITNCNFWQSAARPARSIGIRSAGLVHCLGSRYVGFEGYSIQCTGGAVQLVGNEFSGFGLAQGVIEAAQAGQSVITGNRIIGGTVGAMVTLGNDTVVSGNYIEQRFEHACVDLSQGKSNINVSGNVVCVRPATTKIAEHSLIISMLPNVNYSGGCTLCLINGNTLNVSNAIGVDPAHNQIVNNLMP